jgi:putative hydrolase of the HAD superfamily
LAQLGILDFFPHRLYSYQFEFRKPDRRIFEAAEASIGEPSANILFVGDRLGVDIWPAIEAGMRAVMKSAWTNEDKEPPKGVWKIDRIAELPGLIEKINGLTAENPSTSSGQAAEAAEDFLTRIPSTNDQDK